MKWQKLGQILSPNNNYEWMVSHAAVPFADYIGNDNFRIYFGTRNVNNCASVACIEVELNAKCFNLRKSAQLVLGNGELGTFDDSGVLPSWIVTNGCQKYLYYIGWNLGVTVPFSNFTGLAISSERGGSFQRISKAPIMDRDDIDPFFFTNPCVIIDADDVYKMWYLSCVGWKLEDNKPQHYYHIKYADSDDGIHWNRQGITCIDFKSDDEYAISRPSVLKDGEIYKMWYSYRGQSYRIGYAESENGIDWIRMDEQVGIDVSKSGWDSEMIEYPHVFDHQGERYMLYNGNGYGKTGFGLAVLVET